MRGCANQTTLTVAHTFTKDECTLDPILDTIEEIDNGMVMHVHLNSQGYNDGLILGGPGKFDIDHGTRINGFNIAMAKLFLECGYPRWFAARIPCSYAWHLS